MTGGDDLAALAERGRRVRDRREQRERRRQERAERAARSAARTLLHESLAPRWARLAAVAVLLGAPFVLTFGSFAVFSSEAAAVVGFFLGIVAGFAALLTMPGAVGRRALARLRRTTLPLDVDGYLAILGTEHGFTSRVTVVLHLPAASEPDRRLIADAVIGRLGEVETAWRDGALHVTSPPLRTQIMNPRGRDTFTNVRLHRWVTGVLRLVPVVAPIRRVARIEVVCR